MATKEWPGFLLEEYLFSLFNVPSQISRGIQFDGTYQSRILSHWQKKGETIRN